MDDRAVPANGPERPTTEAVTSTETPPAQPEPLAEAPLMAAKAVPTETAPPETVPAETLPAEAQPPSETPPTATAPPGPDWKRWAVTGAATVLVVAVIVAAFLLLRSGGRPSLAAALLPADTIAYGEVTADPSGDQRALLLGLLQRFPGFEDQSNLGQKIDETLGKLLESSQVDYVKDVKPWLGSSAAFGVRSTGLEAADVQAVFLVASTDDAKAAAFIDQRSAAARSKGAVVTSETYRGVGVTTIESSPGATAFAVAVVAKHLVVGSPEGAVKAVIDVTSGGSPATSAATTSATSPTGGAASLAETKLFKDAVATMPAARVATLFVNYGHVLDLVLNAARSLSGPTALPAVQVSGDAALAGYIRAESDAMVLDLSGVGQLTVVSSPAPSSVPTPPADLFKSRASRLDKSIPASALLAYEIHDLGPAVRFALDSAKATQPNLEESLRQIEQALALTGTPLDVLLGAVGDTAVIVDRGGTLPNGGLLVEVRDKPTVERLLGQLGTLAGFGGGQIKTEQYKGVTLYELDLSALGQTPGLPAVVPTYALSGDLLIVGSDPAFAHAVIDTQGGAAALAGQDNYKAVMARASTDNLEAFYLDVAGVVELAKSQGTAVPDDVVMWLKPIAAFGFTASAPADGAAGHVRFVVLIK